MSPGKFCTVGLGELLWDRLPNGTLPGGAPANFTFHAKQLGVDAVVVSAVGQDANGDALIDWLGRIGLPTDYIQRTGEPTGMVEVAFDAQQQPRYVIPEHIAWDRLAWNPTLADLAGRADCVCVGSLAQRSSLSRETIHRFLAATRPDCLRVFDINVRRPHFSTVAIQQTLRQVNVLKLNDEEWPVVAAMLRVSSDYRIGLPQLLDRTGIRVIAMTRGAEGSVLVDRNGLHVLAGSTLEVTDTIGAGDAFTAALAVGLLRGEPISRIQSDAATVAGYVCTRPGATPLLPTKLIRQVVRPTGIKRRAEPQSISAV